MSPLSHPTRLWPLALVLAFVVGRLFEAKAQARRTPPTRPSPAAPKPRETPMSKADSARWKADHYIVDRDSAFRDPRIGLKKLMNGNRRFIENKSIRPRQDRDALTSQEAGQTPFAIIIGCSDSRVPNEIIFDQGVGDLFILRTAGQVMAEASFGSIEYATLILGSKLIVVLGHEACGAVEAAYSRPNIPGHIVSLVNSIKPAAEKARALPGNKLENAIRQNVVEQVKQLRTLDPVLSRGHENGELLIVGAVYHLSTGVVEFLPETLKDVPTLKK